MTMTFVDRCIDINLQLTEIKEEQINVSSSTLKCQIIVIPFPLMIAQCGGYAVM